MHPKNKLERVLENVSNGRAYSEYVNEFVRTRLCESMRFSDDFLSWRRKSTFVKEIDEAYACLYRVREIMQKRERSGRNSSDECDDKVRFIDMCSGKGFLSLLLAFEYPRASVDMIDISNKVDLTHLRAKETNNVRFHRLDLKSDECHEIVDSACANGEFVFLVGVHLCGDLSRVAIELFRRAHLRNRNNNTAIVLFPCCLPQRRRHDCFGYHVKDQAKGLKLDNYKLWCIFLSLEMRSSLKLTLNDLANQKGGVHMMQDYNMLANENSGKVEDVKNIFLCCLLCPSTPDSSITNSSSKGDCEIVASITNASKWKIVRKK